MKKIKQFLINVIRFLSGKQALKEKDFERKEIKLRRKVVVFHFKAEGLYVPAYLISHMSDEEFERNKSDLSLYNKLFLYKNDIGTVYASVYEVQPRLFFANKHDAVEVAAKYAHFLIAGEKSNEEVVTDINL